MNEGHTAYLVAVDNETHMLANMYSVLIGRSINGYDVQHLDDEVILLRGELSKLKKSYKRMKPENFEKRVEELFAKSTVIKQKVDERLKAIKELEYLNETGQFKEGEKMEVQPLKETVPIEQEEKPKSTRKKKTGKIKDPDQIELPIRGGVRPGAGRKSKGVKKPITMALPQEHWDYIDSLIQNGDYRGYTDIFRQAIYANLPDIEPEE